MTEEEFLILWYQMSLSGLFPYLGRFAGISNSNEETFKSFDGSEKHSGTSSELHRCRAWAWLLSCIQKLKNSQQS